MPIFKTVPHGRLCQQVSRKLCGGVLSRKKASGDQLRKMLVGANLNKW